jgi:hypothetical protein
MSPDHLDQLGQQLKLDKSAACRRAIERILAMIKKRCDEGVYQDPNPSRTGLSRNRAPARNRTVLRRQPSTKRTRANLRQVFQVAFAIREVKSGSKTATMLRFFIERSNLRSELIPVSAVHGP